MAYYISNIGTHDYFKVSAKTLRGAKIMATKRFNLTVTGYLEVLEDSPYPGNPPVRATVKYAVDKRWKDIE